MKLAGLGEVELQFRVERLLARYAQCIDDDQLEAWPESARNVRSDDNLLIGNRHEIPDRV